MSVKMVSNIDSYIGTAAERAAMSTDGVKIGSIFEESDTSIVYKWSGTNWFQTGV